MASGDAESDTPGGGSARLITCYPSHCVNSGAQSSWPSLSKQPHTSSLHTLFTCPSRMCCSDLQVHRWTRQRSGFLRRWPA